MGRLDLNFNHRVVAITGAATGNGRAAVMAFVAGRAKTIIGDIGLRTEAVLLVSYGISDSRWVL